MVEKKGDPKKRLKEGLFSVFGYSKNKNYAKDTESVNIEHQSNMKSPEHITKDFAEKLIREKVESAIKAYHSDIKGKIAEIITKLPDKFNKKIENAISESRSDTEGKIEETSINQSNEFDKKISDAINESRSDTEGKIEETSINQSNEFDKKISDAINESRSDTEGKIEDAISVLRADMESKIEDSTTRLSNELDKKISDTFNTSHSDTKGEIDDAVNVLRADMESKIEDSTTKLSNELEEKIRSQSDEISSNLRDEYRKQTEELLNTAKSTTLAKRIYVIGIGSAFVVIIILLSLIGYSRIKSTANDTIMSAIESQARLEDTKYIKRDFAESLISEKVESTINELQNKLDAGLEEKTDKLFGQLEENIKLKNIEILSKLQDEYRKKREESIDKLLATSDKKPNMTAKDIQVQGTPDKTLGNLLEYNDVINKKKREREYIFEERHKEGFSEPSNKNDPPEVAYLSDAIRLNPNNQGAYRDRGDAYYSLKQYKKAIADYNKAIELDPENVIAYGRRGDAYGRLKQYKAAIKDYDKAVSLDPAYAPVYNNRANLLYTIRQYEKAIEDYSKTIELDPENDTVYSNRGLAYSGLEQYEKAIEDYKRAIELAPEDAYNYVYLSKINIFTGNYDRALAVITKASSIPAKKELKALALYIECIVEKLLGLDTSLSERKFSKIIKEDFTIWWDFIKLDSWLENADIDDETKAFIKAKSRMLRTHLK